MKVHISSVNGFDDKNELMDKQKHFADIGRNLGFYDLGIFRFDVKTDSDSELLKRLDGIISSVDFNDLVYLQLPTGNGYEYDSKLLFKLRGYTSRIVLIMHSYFLDKKEKREYMKMLPNFEFIITDKNSFARECLAFDFKNVKVVKKLDDFNIRKIFYDTIEDAMYSNNKMHEMELMKYDDEIHIGFGLYDKIGNYTPWLGVTIQSILEHTDSHVCFHILHDDTLNAYNRRNLIEMVDCFESRILFHRIDVEMFNSVKKQIQKYTIGAMFRILLPSMFKNLHKIIYLDADLLVNRDIKELWDIDVDNYCLAAVPDLNVKLGRVWAYPVREKEVDQKEYFNSGVLVMNLDKIRNKGDMEKQIIDYLQFHNYSNLPDQDALNVIYKGDVLFLDENWNYFAENVRLNKEVELKKKIYHYVGNICCLYSLTGMDLLYYKTGCRTPWGHKHFDAYLISSLNRCNNRIKQYELLVPILTGENVKKVFYGPEKLSMRYLYDLIGINEGDYRVLNENRSDGILPCYSLDKIKSEKDKIVIFVLVEADNGNALKNLNDMGLIEEKDYFIIQKLVLNEYGGYLL